MECENCQNPCEKVHGKNTDNYGLVPRRGKPRHAVAPGGLRLAQPVVSSVAIRRVGDDSPLAHRYGWG